MDVNPSEILLIVLLVVIFLFGGRVLGSARKR
jgi:Sec-independent protein translocase protein TatA